MWSSEGESIPGSGRGMGQGPEAGPCLVCGRNSPGACVVGAERGRGREGGREGGEGTGTGRGGPWGAEGRIWASTPGRGGEEEALEG